MKADTHSLSTEAAAPGLICNLGWMLSPDWITRSSRTGFYLDICMVLRGTLDFCYHFGIKVRLKSTHKRRAWLNKDE